MPTVKEPSIEYVKEQIKKNISSYEEDIKTINMKIQEESDIDKILFLIEIHKKRINYIDMLKITLETCFVDYNDLDYSKD